MIENLLRQVGAARFGVIDEQTVVMNLRLDWCSHGGCQIVPLPGSMHTELIAKEGDGLSA